MKFSKINLVLPPSNKFLSTIVCTPNFAESNYQKVITFI